MSALCGQTERRNMSLNRQQVDDLGEAIAAYRFPAVYFDFDKGREVRAPDMRSVEAAIGGMLVSAATDRIRDGLANVIYWGYAQIGYRNDRVRRFRAQVTADELGRFASLVRSGSPGLMAIGALRLPQFSGISFVSKVLTFLDPKRYCVLDKQLLKLGLGDGARALHRVAAGTQIRITTDNEDAYDSWRAECGAISDRYFGGRHRVVDIERGFFQLVQTNRVGAAREMYSAA
jgi:hypothetical protein